MNQTRNRPRESILQLFDPLSCPEPHDVSAIDSDKENFTDDQLVVTNFFNPKKPPYSGLPPLTPRGRLVDLSMSMDGDMFSGGVIVEEEGEDLEEPSHHPCDTPEPILQHTHANTGNGEDDTITIQFGSNFPTPRMGELFATPRTPLAEAPFEMNITPVPRKKVYKREVIPPVTNSTAPTTQSLEISPQELSLSTVVHNINAAGVPFAAAKKYPGPRLVRKEAVPRIDEEKVLEERSPYDQPLTILVAPPPEDELSSGPAAPTVISESRFLRPRSHTTTAALSAHRSSVDLHASFSLQIQCPDASFDLLNDKISFLGMERYMLDQEDGIAECSFQQKSDEGETPTVADCKGTLSRSQDLLMAN